MYKILSCIVIGLCLAGSAVAVPKMVAHWPFNDGSGSVAVETVAGLNGTLMNFDTSAAWTADSARGGALIFDGVDDHVIVPHNEAIDFADEDFSISFLLKQNGGFVAIAGFTEQRYFSKGTYAATTGIRYEMFNKGGNVRFSIDDGTTKVDVSAAEAPFVTNEWVHVVAVRDATQDMMFLYADGVQVGSIATGALGSAANSAPLVFGTSTAADKPTSIGFFAGAMDDFRIFAKALTADGIATIYKGFRPEDGATDVARDIVLSWAQSGSAITYNVYLGTSLDEVQNADINSPLLVGRGQDANWYDPAGLLELETTYYWRVDEIGAPPESKVVKGEVWSFTTEPYAYPLSNVIATASSSDKAEDGPQNTVNGSGLTDDLHSTATTAMWLSSSAGPEPVWIQYEFDRVYKLHELWVWNYNVDLESIVGYGFKDVAMEYSLDGTAWTLLQETQFAQASAVNGYAHNTTVALDGVMARYVRLTARSNWSAIGLKQCGLSEVRFFHVPVMAREPQPANGTADVAADIVLNWRAGREATSHKVYLGTDQTAVTEGTVAAVTTAERSYAPAPLMLGTTYFWRVDEIGAAGTCEGDVWSFSTAQFQVVDDFESYTNDSPKRVFQVWIDGLGFSPDEFFPQGHSGNGTGSMVGHDPAAGNIMETSTVHGGRQSMPVAYDGPSETTRSFEPAQDWTRGGITTLVLFFQGASTNVAGELHVKVNGTKVPYSGGAGDLALAEWKQWNIALPAAAGLGSVKTLTIGVSSGQGMLYIDDISLSRSAPAVNP